jgi:heptose II phosphotransferase
MKVKNITQNEKLYYDSEKNLELHHLIEKKQYKILKVLKEDHRSQVFLIEVYGEKYVLKIPLEKNSRGWQRFLSIFRKGESYREFKNCRKILNLNFNGPTPVLSWEKFKYGMVVDSYSVTTYVDGKTTTVNEVELVLKLLKEIHKKGLLHGDPHLGNFIITNGEIYLLDCKLEKNFSSNIGIAYEIKYLENSCHNGCKLYEGKEIYYWLAVKRDEFYHWWRKFKKKIRGR